MERLAGKQNANGIDHLVMMQTRSINYVGTKVYIKGASVVMGYLETECWDSQQRTFRLQELAVWCK